MGEFGTHEGCDHFLGRTRIYHPGEAMEFRPAMAICASLGEQRPLFRLHTAETSPIYAAFKDRIDLIGHLARCTGRCCAPEDAFKPAANWLHLGKQQEVSKAIEQVMHSKPTPPFSPPRKKCPSGTSGVEIIQSYRGARQSA